MSSCGWEIRFSLVLSGVLLALAPPAPGAVLSLDAYSSAQGPDASTVNGPAGHFAGTTTSQEFAESVARNDVNEAYALISGAPKFAGARSWVIYLSGHGAGTAGGIAVSRNFVTLNAPPGHVGSSQAVVQARVRLHGEVTAQTTGQTGYSLTAQGSVALNGSHLIAKSMHLDGGVFSGDESGTFTIEYTVGFGQTNELTFEAIADAGGATINGGTFDLSANFLETAAWMGVVSVKDCISGEPVVGYTMTDDNGLDWTTPAPEPGSFALALGALALLASRRRPLKQLQHQASRYKIMGDSDAADHLRMNP